MAGMWGYVCTAEEELGRDLASAIYLLFTWLLLLGLGWCHGGMEDSLFTHACEDNTASPLVTESSGLLILGDQTYALLLLPWCSCPETGSVSPLV